MKTFYTERDIEDMHAAGVKAIEVCDDVVLTDVAREKALALGMKLKPVANKVSQPEQILKNLGANLPAPAKPVAPPASTFAKATASASINTPSTDTELVERIKAGVIAKIGTTAYNGLLDQIIPQVLARFNAQAQAGSGSSSSSQSRSDY